MERPKHLSFLNYASVITFLFLIALCAHQLIIATGEITFSSPFFGFAFVGSLLLGGYLAADFLSGFVHFLGDSFGDVDTPLVGKTFIYPFREHHVDQKAITRHDFFETNGHNCLVSTPVLLIEYLTFPTENISLGAFAFALFCFSLVFFIFCTNQFHKWAHQDHPAALVRWLHSTGVILTPKRHRKHHVSPFESHFCITTGWLNELLEKIHFFSLAKKVLAKIPGMPKVYKAK